MNIGSAWKKISKNGKNYMSCVLQSPFLPGGEIRFAIFAVEEKKSENSPDYNIVWNISKPNQTQQNNLSDDDIPF